MNGKAKSETDEKRKHDETDDELERELDHVRQDGGNSGAVSVPPQAAIFGNDVASSARPVMVSRLM